MVEHGSAVGLPRDRLFSDEALLQHAERCWRAECDNASRLSARINFLLSGTVALFGLGLFRVEWFRGGDDVARIAERSAVLGIRWMLVLSLFCFVLAFWRLLSRTGAANPWNAQQERSSCLPASSSRFLALPDWFLRDPPVAPSFRRQLIFSCVYRAYLDLRERNTHKDHRIRRAQPYFIMGVFLVILAVATYNLLAE